MNLNMHALITLIILTAQTRIVLTGTPPVVTMSSASFEWFVGQTVILQCTVSSPDSNLLSVDWIFMNENGTIFLNAATDSSKYSGMTQTYPSLIIYNLSNSDVGSYTCTGTNKFGTGRSKTALALAIKQVKGIPFVTINSTSYTTSFGTSVKMECTVFSNSTVLEVYWRRHTEVGTQLIRYNTIGISGSSTEDPSLTIEVTTYSDSGSYICVASNRHGSGQSEVTNLIITGSIPIVKVNTTTIRTMFGESVTLGVEISSHPQYSTVYWERNVNGHRSLIYSGTIGIDGVSVDNPSLTINFPTMSDDAIYVCYAENALGTGKSQNILLIVSGGLPEVHINSTVYEAIFGEEVAIPCIIQSSPVHTHVFWEKKTDGITTKITATTAGIRGATIQNPTLVILFSTMSDSGLYTCYAKNVIGIGSSRATSLTISGGKPLVEVDSSLHTVVIGNRITMSCRVTAVPPAIEIYWWKRISGDIYSTISSGTTGTTGASVEIPSLTLIMPTKSDSGVYYCFATNDIGTGGSLPTILTVIGDEPVVTVPSVKLNVNFGDNITLPCEVNAVPSHTEVYWTHNKDGIVRYIYFHTSGISGVEPSYPSLVIQTVTTTDSGFYTCFSKNIVGTGASQQLHLTVRGDIPIVETPLLKVTVYHGQTAVLLCIVYANPTLTHVYWERLTDNGVLALNHGTTGTIGITISNPSLTLIPVYTSDSGSYTCVATNAVGSSRSRQIMLEVLVKSNVTVNDHKLDSESSNGLSSTEIIVTVLSGSVGSAILVVFGYIFHHFGAPIFTLPESKIEATIGKQTEMKINVKSTLEFKNIKWHKKCNQNNAISNVIITNQGNSIHLTYKFTEITETGFYYCTARTFFRTGKSPNMYVEVKKSWIPPIVKIHVDDINGALPGNSITLTCVVISDDEIKDVRWEKIQQTNERKNVDVSNNSKYSGGTKHKPSLSIYNLALEDIGQYCCIVESCSHLKGEDNYILQANGSFKLNILPETPKGIDKKIVCEIEPMHIIKSIVWERHGQGPIDSKNTRYLTEDEKAPSLTIKDFTADDNGSYRCRITNTFGISITSEYVALNDNTPLAIEITDVDVTNILSNKTVTFQCCINSPQCITGLEWTFIDNENKERQLLDTDKYIGGTKDTPSLTIRNLEQEDFGLYICTVIASPGREKCTCKYNLKGPHFQVTLSEESKNTDENKKIHCDIYPPNIIKAMQWTMDGKTIDTTDPQYKIEIGAVNSLTIKNFKAKNEGKYACIFTNQFGTTEYSQINLEASSFDLNLQEQSNDADQKRVIQCYVTPEQNIDHVAWMKDSIVIDTENHVKYKETGGALPSLTIQQFEISDNGLYNCCITNMFEKSKLSNTIKLEVT